MLIATDLYKTLKKWEYQNECQQYNGDRSVGSAIASVVKVTETPCHFIIEIAANNKHNYVQMFNK